MTATDPPWRINGVYRWHHREYTLIDLSTPEQPWRALGLMGHPFLMHEGDINYLRPDGTIIDVNFQPIGTADELEDTGRTMEAGDG